MNRIYRPASLTIRDEFNEPDKAKLIHRETGNLHATQILLGHINSASTVRAPGIEIAGALALFESIEPSVSQVLRVLIFVRRRGFCMIFELSAAKVQAVKYR